MRFLRRLLVVLLLGAGLGGGGRAATFDLPPITGELTGRFRSTWLPADSPPVEWRMSVARAEGGGRQLEIELKTSGGRLHARAELNATLTDGRWEVVDGELDAAVWLALLAPKLGSSMENLVVEGKLVLRGEGLIKEGQPSGTMSLAWSDGVIRDTVANWRLDGVSIRGDVAVDGPDLGATRSVRPWEFAVRTISSPRFGARNLRAVANLNGDGTATLEAAEIEIAGGKITVDRSTVALFPPVLDFTVHVDRVGLQDLVALVPATLADARGRIDGVVRLGWSQRAGVQIGEGQFDLRADEAATLRLAPTVGLITANVPERLDLLPKWKRAVGNWFSPLNPVYGDARAIELGRTPLTIETFSVRLTPKGDAQGRTATVQISARPENAGVLVKRVKFDIDLTGSLSRLLNLNADGRATLKIH